MLGVGCTSVASPPTTVAPPSDLLVVATRDGAVVVYDGSLEEVATFSPPDGSVYQQPTWLSAELVVFAERSDVGDHALVAGDVTTGAVSWRSTMDTPPFYFAPAPSGSDYATTSLRVNPGADLISELVDRDGIATTLDTASPFYTSWSPDGASIAINLPGDRLDVLAGEDRMTIVPESNGYQAPVWLEAGLVHLRDTEEGRYLALWEDGRTRDIAAIDDAAIFVGSGSTVALKVANGPESQPGVQASLRTQTDQSVGTGRFVLIDLATGSITEVSTEPTAVFQFDPTGERLLYATASLEVGLTLEVFEDGESIEIGAVRPNPEWVATVVPFFDQYAQSTSFWSASGERVAVPGVVDGRPVVAVYGLDGGEPALVDDAVWASWYTES